MIHIDEEYRYFTHLPGKESVIPLTKATAKVYPCRIEVTSGKTAVIDLQISGPVRGFTHLLNMEKGRVEIFGTALEGYFHLFLTGRDGKIYLKIKRGGPLGLIVDGRQMILNKGEEIELLEASTMPMKQLLEKVSFGCSKKPLLENAVAKETKLYCLAQLIPQAPIVEMETVEPFLVDLFSPKTEDSLYRGFNAGAKMLDKFSLYSSFFHKFRSMIILEKEGEIHLLQGKLPHAGRALGLACDGCTIDLMWKKGKVVRMILFPSKNGTKKLIFSAKVSSFRIKGNPKEKGKILCVNDHLFLEQGRSLYIDRIQG